MTDNEEITKKARRKTLKGVVISDRMDKTAVVEISRFAKHPRYRKFITIRKKIKAHDENNSKKIGDEVVIEETRPISKDKRYKVIG